MMILKNHLEFLNSFCPYGNLRFINLEGGIRMAPPKKYSTQPNLFSFRCEKDKWGIFTLVAKVKGTSPTEIFSGVVDKYIKENQDILSALPSTSSNASVESYTPGKRGPRTKKERMSAELAGIRAELANAKEE